MLRLKLLRSFILSSSPFKYISSCIKCSRWHPGTERNWSLLDRSLQEELRGAVQVPPALLTPLGAAPGTCGPWAGQEGQGDIYRWAGKWQVGFLDLFYCERVSHSLFSTLSSSVVSLSLCSYWKEGFPVLFCSFTQYLWYWCVLLSSESERRQKKPRYCILFVELMHRPTVTVLQVVCFSKEATELRQLWTVFLLPTGFWITGM